MLARRQLVIAFILPVLLLALRPVAAEPGSSRSFKLAADSPEVINLSAYSEYLLDQSNRLSIDDTGALAQQAWQASGDNDYLQFGIGESNAWVRISIDNIADKTLQRLLEIDRPLLDTVDIVISNSLGETKYHLGAVQAFADRLIPHRNLVIPTRLPPGETTTIYMRLQTAKALTFSLLLLTEKALNQSSSRHLSITSLCLGSMLFGVLFCLYQFVRYRRPTYAYLALSSIALALFNITQLGYGNQFLWPENQWLSNRASVLTTCGTAVLGTLFGASYLARNGLSQFAHRALLLFASINALLLLGAMIVPYGAAIRLALPLSFLGMIFTAACAAIVALHKGRNTWIHLSGWIILMASATLSLSHMLGWAPPTYWAEQGTLVGSALATLVWALALTDQYEFEAQRTLEEREQNVRRGLRQQTELHSQLQSLQDENRHFELLLQKADRLDSTTGLLNITAFHSELDCAYRAALRYGHTLSVIALEIDDLKAINDARGHQVGNACLASVALAISESLRRPGDIAGRITGSRMGIVLPYTDIDGALEVIQGIKQRIQAWTRSDSSAPTLSLRVGIASTENRLARHAEDLIESAVAQIPNNDK